MQKKRLIIVMGPSTEDACPVGIAHGESLCLLLPVKGVRLQICFQARYVYGKSACTASHGLSFQDCGLYLLALQKALLVSC